jgi:UDP-N-acetylglucosamine--N-acetylmuramyl-(pentapeptide) pyrophosphoryl-undecaprenol N-acetylglucosamine transferase
VSRVVFAGGGTAGHIEPALAVARAFQSAHPESDILFLGTRAGLEVRLVPEAGFTLSLISKVRIPRTLSLSLLAIPFALTRSVLQCVSVIRGADLLVGFGGYVSGPAYIAAALTRTPFVIHEANSRPGLANRFGARLTPFTAITHSIASGPLSDSLLAGLPLREDIVKAFEDAEGDWDLARRSAKSALGFLPTKPLIFIFGGSQGSAAINAVIAESKSSLIAKDFQILHGVGAKNELPSSTDFYHAESYISDMASAYLAADIVISRSGAVTCAEVNTLGRYALFIPLPIGNGEQEINAADLVSQSRAEIRSQNEFTAQWLLSHIDQLILKSQIAPIAGSAIDIKAADKIASLMQYALSGGK